MSIGSIIYRILIGPLELFFEVIFELADRHVSNPAYAIIILSLAMNFLVLPLYRRADAVQAEERDRENALAPWIKHIKKTFKGDERFMMLQAYYRENNYKPTDTLKGSISLLLEIPFFIAAYRFLSGLETLRGVSFGPITDLGVPDALISIGSVTLNLLPILMTLINVISAAIYMKGFPLKSKVQMYGVAAIFLVFLYKSPAGLVFYWTLNNLFSLLKNIFYKIPHPDKVLKILASVCGAILLIFVIFIHPMPTLRAQAIVIAGLLCLQIPLLKGNRKMQLRGVDEKDAAAVFYASSVFLALMTGILIPSSVIADSTEEFLNISSYYSPYWYIISSLTIAFGTFFVWFGIFYRLASREGKQIFSLLMAVLAAGSTVNYMFFGKTYGNLSSTLVFDNTPEIEVKSIFINMVVLIAVIMFITLIFLKKMAIVKVVSIAMCLTLVVMSGMNLVSVQKTLSGAASVIEAAIESEPEISLSKNGKNVVVIMMDRQIGHFVPFIMHEKQELKDIYEGFTYYSNSISYGNFTNVGTPGLYGGYEYIPAEMNRRSDVKLADKHNEAIKVMPKLFTDAGFDVTVLDPTYAGYNWIPDLSIYDDIPGIRTGITNGRYSLEEYSYVTDEESEKALRNRNFFLYSIFKTSPVFAQPTIYSKGSYNAPKEDSSLAEQVVIDEYHADGFDPYFMKPYAVLDNMIAITDIKDSRKNTFLMMSNDLTHNTMMLQEPEYKPSAHVDNSDIGENYMKKEDDEGNTLVIKNIDTLMHYQTNVAAMIKLGEWLDYLKKEDLYDNTRIIIVSDHGNGLDDGIAATIEIEKDGEKQIVNTGFFNCVMLVKDFDSRDSRTEEELITNADVPSLAADALIKDPVNPYSGNRLGRYSDQAGNPEIIYTFDWEIDENDGNIFMPADWFTVKGNIYDSKNWEYLGYH